jgi:hypothetical protein
MGKTPIYRHPCRFVGSLGTVYTTDPGRAVRMAAGLHHAAGRSAGHQGYQANKGPGWGGCRRPPVGPPTRAFGSASFTFDCQQSRSEFSHHDTLSRLHRMDCPPSSVRLWCYDKHPSSISRALEPHNK